MASTINTNISSLTAQRNLSLSQSSLNTSIQRLSSGLRINSAKDDAAGLAYLGAVHLADPRDELGGAQCQRRHFAVPGGGKCAGGRREHPAAGARTVGAIGQRHQFGR